MRDWSWKDGLIFAFAKKLLSKEGIEPAYEISIGERFGSQILNPLYRIVEFISKNIRIPLAICLFTMLAALILGFAFYSIPAFVIFGKLMPIWLIRLLLFIYVQMNIFALGCLSFGRFNNKALVDLWKNGRLKAVMPGDYEKER